VDDEQAMGVVRPRARWLFARRRGGRSPASRARRASPSIPRDGSRSSGRRARGARFAMGRAPSCWETVAERRVISPMSGV
jgi:hypothetical protein